MTDNGVNSVGEQDAALLHSQLPGEALAQCLIAYQTGEAAGGHR
jgi:hypothetical protein